MKKHRILLVDNDPYELKCKKVQFFNCGYNIKTSTNASDAKLQLMVEDFDIVITDVMMPGTNGYELVEYVKLKYPYTKVFTASCRTSGCDLIKPYKPQDVFNLLHEINNVIDFKARFR